MKSPLGLLVGLAMVGSVQTQASLFYFSAQLHGGQEVPPNGSLGWGTATGLFDDETQVFSLGGQVGALSSGITAANIHQGDPGVAGPAILPLTANVGFNLGPINSDFFALTPNQVSNLFSGHWYVNVNTAEFPEGEIRGQILLGSSVPEPESFAFLGALTLAGFALWRRHRPTDAA
jgi:hypothetical protein